MKIGVMSDSHDNLPRLRAALALLQREGTGMLIHAGDFVAPFAVREILKFSHRVVGVFGNNDGERAGIAALWPEVSPPPHTLRIADRDVLVVHDRDKIDAEEAHKADIFIYGHNHQAKVATENGTLCVNPGECGGWVTGRATVAIIDTDTMQARILEVEEE